MANPNNRLTQRHQCSLAGLEQADQHGPLSSIFCLGQLVQDNVTSMTLSWMAAASKEELH